MYAINALLGCKSWTPHLIAYIWVLDIWAFMTDFSYKYLTREPFLFPRGHPSALNYLMAEDNTRPGALEWGTQCPSLEIRLRSGLEKRTGSFEVAATANVFNNREGCNWRHRGDKGEIQEKERKYTLLRCK